MTRTMNTVELCDISLFFGDNSNKHQNLTRLKSPCYNGTIDYPSIDEFSITMLDKKKGWLSCDAVHVARLLHRDH